MSADPIADDRPAYYSAAEAAAMLGIARRTLNTYAKQGRIAVLHHGGKAWVTRAALADYWARLNRAADQRRVAVEKRARKTSRDVA